MPRSNLPQKGGLQLAPRCRFIRSQNLRQQLRNSAVKFCPRRNQRWAFLPAPSILSLGIYLGCGVGSFLWLFKSCFFVCCSSLVLRSANPVGSQSQVFWRLIPQVEALKVGALDMWSKPFALLRKAGVVVGFFPIVWSCVGGGIYGKSCFSLSYSF